MSRKQKQSPSKQQTSEPEALSLSAGELLRFASAMIVASGAAYLLGYLGQIDIHLFSYIGPAEFLNAAIVYLPVSIVLAALNGLQIFFRESITYASPTFDRYWKTKKGEWGNKTRFRIRIAALLAVLLLAGILALPLRFNFDLSPLAGIGCTLFFLVVGNEIYRYGEARYQWNIRNFPLLLSAFYFLVTSIFIGALHVEVHENSLDYKSVLKLEDGNYICATAHKRIGSRLLYYNVERADWQTIKLSEVEKTYALTNARFVFDQSCEEFVKSLESRRVTSFMLSRPIEEEELISLQSPSELSEANEDPNGPK